MTVFHVFNVEIFFPCSENRIEQFGRFIKTMDESVKAIQDRGQIHSEKCQGCKSEKLYLRYRQMRVHRDEI